jgi:hypothetical protein
MTDDDTIRKLKADALEVARRTPIQKNPAAYRLADKILALSDDFFYGRKQPSPLAQAKVLEILALAGEYYRGERKPTPRVRAIARQILAAQVT